LNARLETWMKSPIEKPKLMMLLCKKQRQRTGTGSVSKFE
jgi:hypothetical protein